jgi:hypothetical protein
MRRIALLAGGTEGDVAAAWLESLPGIAATRYPSLGRLPLSSIDILWVHGATEAGWETGLLGWLATGGRLLATLDGTRLPYDIGLETAEPCAIPDATQSAGLAGFGPHPLFAGAGHGVPPSDHAPFGTTWCRAGDSPKGGAVAVAWQPDGVDPSRVLAWELRAGDGGALCIGARVALADRGAAELATAQGLLANALSGDAIPHRDRVAVATLWPAIAGAPAAGAPAIARRDAAAPIPRIPDFGGHWAPTGSEPGELLLAPHAEWRHAGRRILLTGTAMAGLRDAWTHPFRIIRDASLTLVDRAVEPAAVRAGPLGVERVLPVGAYTVVERLTTALELPLLVWEIAADGDVFFRAEWVVDFARTAPYRRGASGPIVTTVSEGGRRLWAGTDGAALQAVFAVDGARFERLERAAGEIRVVCAGTGRCRILAVGGEDSADLDRTLELLARRGFAGLQRQRSQHVEHLLRYGLAIETGDSALDAALRNAALAIDAALVEAPGVGRSLADTGDPARGAFTGAAAATIASVAVAVGQRELARDVVRFLRSARDVAGRSIERYATSGLVLEAAHDARAHDTLATRYLAWTGDGAPGPGPAHPPREAERIAQPDDLAERLRSAATRAGMSAASGDPAAAAALLDLAVTSLIGAVSDAPGGLLTLRPALPADWPGLVVRRLRIGRTQLDLELLRRPGRIVARVHRTAGPPITIDLALAGHPTDAVTLDDEPLGAARARFDVTEHHEVVFHAAS